MGAVEKDLDMEEINWMMGSVAIYALWRQPAFQARREPLQAGAKGVTADLQGSIRLHKAPACALRAFLCSPSPPLAVN